MIISFEGIDGSGKSTQAHRLLHRLAREGYEPLFVREPGGTDLSERIREMLLDSRNRIDPMAEMLLFSAARAQLVSEEIVPHSRSGGVVICDRFFDSTVAYQGGGRGIADPKWLLEFQETVTGGVVPDRTYYIRVPVDVARARLAHRDSLDGADRMESEDGAFFSRVTHAYDRIAEWAAGRVRVIDGARQADDIETAIWQDVEGILPERN